MRTLSPHSTDPTQTVPFRGIEILILSLISLLACYFAALSLSNAIQAVLIGECSWDLGIAFLTGFLSSAIGYPTLSNTVFLLLAQKNPPVSPHDSTRLPNNATLIPPQSKIPERTIGLGIFVVYQLVFLVLSLWDLVGNKNSLSVYVSAAALITVIISGRMLYRNRVRQSLGRFRILLHPLSGQSTQQTNRLIRGELLFDKDILLESIRLHISLYWRQTVDVIPDDATQIAITQEEEAWQDKYEIVLQGDTGPRKQIAFEIAVPAWLPLPNQDRIKTKTTTIQITDWWNCDVTLLTDKPSLQERFEIRPCDSLASDPASTGDLPHDFVDNLIQKQGFQWRVTDRENWFVGYPKGWSVIHGHSIERIGARLIVSENLLQKSVQQRYSCHDFSRVQFQLDWQGSGDSDNRQNHLYLCHEQTEVLICSLPSLVAAQAIAIFIAESLEIPIVWKAPKA